MTYLLRLWALFAALFLGTVANAAVLTFDSVPECTTFYDVMGYEYYEEAGYVVEARNGGCYGGSKDIYLGYYSEAAYHNKVTFSKKDGGKFDALGFDISSLDYFGDPRFQGLVLKLGDNISITGYRNGSLVAAATASFLEGDSTVKLSGFNNIDELRFDPLEPCECELDIDVLAFLNSPYGFSIDNLNVVARGPAPVPTPPALAGLALGLGLLGGLKRRRR